MVLLAVLAAVVFLNVALWLWQRHRRAGLGAEESDLQAVNSGGVFGAGIGAAHARNAGLGRDEDVKVREDTDPVRFKL